MPKNPTSPKQLVALVVLGTLCAWLVYRNFLAPSEPGAADRLPAVQASQSHGTGDRNPPTAAASPGGPPGRRRGNAVAGTNLDPTLRLDLLEASRAVKYEGPTRNIFQVYTPPPPPPAVPLSPPPSPADGQSPAAPPAAAPTIPLKFYGTAQPPHSQKRKAFLTDGEEIFIGQEGEPVGKFYKITRIGVSTIELEDTRNQQRQQLPLIEE